MDHMEISQLLRDSLADGALDKDEKNQFAQLAQQWQLQPDKVNFIRNQAFALLREQGEFNDQQFRAIKWLENLVKTLDQHSHQPIIVAGACFSPGNECLNQVINLCDQARQTIDVCVFTISCNEITAALLNAHQRGIKVRIITDNDKRDDQGSDVYQLANAGIAVTVDKDAHHMHHKFALFDQRILLNGSFNWTRSASKFNLENIITTDNPKLLHAFGDEFERLWQQLA